MNVVFISPISISESQPDQLDDRPRKFWDDPDPDDSRKLHCHHQLYLSLPKAVTAKRSVSPTPDWRLLMIAGCAVQDSGADSYPGLLLLRGALPHHRNGQQPVQSLSWTYDI